MTNAVPATASAIEEVDEPERGVPATRFLLSKVGGALISWSW